MYILCNSRNVIFCIECILNKYLRFGVLRACSGKFKSWGMLRFVDGRFSGFEGYIDLSSASNNQRRVLAWKMKVLRFFYKLGTIYLMIQHTIPEKFNNNNNNNNNIVVVVCCIPKPSRRLRLTHFLMFKRNYIFPADLFSKTIEILSVIIK